MSAHAFVRSLSLVLAVSGYVCVAGCGDEDGNANHVAPSGPTLCDAYCGFMALNCTRGHLQYIDNDACLVACASFAVSDDEAETAGDTLQCRMVYAVTAEAPERKQTFCDNAGPSGGEYCRL